MIWLCRHEAALLCRWGDGPIIAALSIVEEGDVKKIRMGHLAIIGSNKINGVAALHTEIIKKESVFCTARPSRFVGAGCLSGNLP